MEMKYAKLEGDNWTFSWAAIARIEDEGALRQGAVLNLAAKIAEAEGSMSTNPETPNHKHIAFKHIEKAVIELSMAQAPTTFDVVNAALDKWPRQGPFAVKYTCDCEQDTFTLLRKWAKADSPVYAASSLAALLKMIKEHSGP